MMRFLAGIVVNALALWATSFVPGITFVPTVLNLLAGGVVIALINGIVRPIAMFLSFPLLIVTLGLFYFVLNGLLLWAASLVVPGYRVSGMVAAMLGALVMGIVNWALWALLGGRKRKDDDD